MKVKNNQLILEYESELIALETMLEDLPYYLSLDRVNLAPMCEQQRKEMLELINKIFTKKVLKKIK